MYLDKKISKVVITNTKQSQKEIKKKKKKKKKKISKRSAFKDVSFIGSLCKINDVLGSSCITFLFMHQNYPRVKLL